MSAQVSLNLLNKLRKRDKIRGLPNILYLSQRDSIYHMTYKITLKLYFCVKTLQGFAICVTLKTSFHNVTHNL